jgi:hypothetical protein
MKDLKNLCKVDKFGKVLSSKLRMNCERPSGFHLFERIVVTAASLVGRKERM